MSERLTAIHLPGVWDSGIADYGRKSVEDMVEQIRKRALHMRATSNAILEAPNDAFMVETYVGVYARKNRDILQRGHLVTPPVPEVDE